MIQIGWMGAHIHVEKVFVAAYAGETGGFFLVVQLVDGDAYHPNVGGSAQEVLSGGGKEIGGYP